MFDLLAGGCAGSRLMSVEKRRLAEHDDSPSGSARFMIKDLRCAVEEAARTGAATPLTDLLLHLFTDLTRRGLGDRDTTTVLTYLEQLSNEGTPA